MGTMQTTLKRLSLSEGAISRAIDPRSGRRLRPLGVVGGRPVYPIMGGAPDDDEDEEKETKDKSDNPEGDASSEDGGGSDKGDPQAKIAALEEEKNRHVRRRTEAEKEAATLRDRLAELEGKDKTELEKITARATELETENKTLQESLRESRLQNAFLSDNTYEWHNPGRALALADLSNVEIDSDGTVHGLKAALDALAKSDAYLLKKKDEGDGSDERPPSTGGSTGRSKRKQSEANADEEALRQKYAALRR